MFTLGKDEKVILEEVKKWVNGNKAHFYHNCKPLYDKENFDRIERFVDAPTDYLDERIDLNKEVSKNYHKFHSSILLAGFTGFYFILLSNVLSNLIEKYGNVDIIYLITNFKLSYISNFDVVSLIILLFLPFVAVLLNLKYVILKKSGLLKVIRDSEIEIYYLSKIKVSRENLICSHCNKEIPMQSIFCNKCGIKIL